MLVQIAPAVKFGPVLPCLIENFGQPPVTPGKNPFDDGQTGIMVVKGYGSVSNMGF